MYELIVRFAADGLVVIIFLLSMYSFAFKIPRNQWWSWGWRIALAGLTAYLAAKVVGYFYQPEALRPFEQRGVEPGAAYLPNPGFPSDHVLFATFLTLAVWLAAKQTKLAIILFALTIAMGVARVLALVHTPVDVIGGFVIAWTGSIWYRRKPGKVVK